MQVIKTQFEQLLVFGATFFGSGNLEKGLSFWATFEKNIGSYSTRKNQRFHELQFMRISCMHGFRRASFVQCPSYRSARQEINHAYCSVRLQSILSFAHICEQLLKAKFQAILDRC